MSHTMKLDSLAARALAEYASGIRGEDGDPEFLVTVEHGSHFSITKTGNSSPCSSAHEVVTPVATPFVQPARPRVRGVSIQAGDMVDPESLMRYDAVFWSEAAVEKFLFPYYASKQQWHAAHALSTLARRWYGFVPEMGKELPTAQAAESAAEDEAIPFAVGHLPRSDYVTLADDVVLLFRNPDGTVSHRPLSEFL